MNWPGRVTTQLRKCFHLGNCVSKLASVQTQSPLQNVAGCDLRTPDQDYRTYCQDRGIDDPEQPLTPAPSEGAREKYPPRYDPRWRWDIPSGGAGTLSSGERVG